MSDELYVVVSQERPQGETDKDVWFRADVVLNGVMYATAYCPDRGIYKSDGIAKKTAVSMAVSKFAKQIGKDVRDASPVPVAE